MLGIGSGNETRELTIVVILCGDALAACDTNSAECAHSILPPTSSVPMAVDIRQVHRGSELTTDISGSLLVFLEGPQK